MTDWRQSCCDVHVPRVSLGHNEDGIPSLAQLGKVIDAVAGGEVRVHLDGFVAPYGFAALEALRRRFALRGGRLVVHDLPGTTFTRPFSQTIGYDGAMGGGPTTIPLQSFDASELASVGSFLEAQWANRADALVGTAASYAVDPVAEVFVNGLTHARSDIGIVACGQFFAKLQELHLSVVDLGIGIPRSLAESRGRREVDIDPARAIAWAFEEGHTTGSTSRGLGLAIFRDFLLASNARLHVWSGRGIAKLALGSWSVATSSRAFPGTLIDLSLPASNVRPPPSRRRNPQ